MNMKPLFRMNAIFFILLGSVWFPVRAADNAAGQTTFTAACSGCHQLKSYGKKSDAELQTNMKGIVAGTTKHPKKLTLSPTDIENVAAYISSNEPK